MNFYEVSRDEAERLHPLSTSDGIRCNSCTQRKAAMVGSVRASTAATPRRAPALRADIIASAGHGHRGATHGSWIVRTPKGDITRQWVGPTAGRLVGKGGRRPGGLQTAAIPDRATSI